MRKIFFIFFVFIGTQYLTAQKDSLQLGDRYAEDQIYTSVSYAQFFNQPKTITRSGFSYRLSVGFLKDFILNKRGSIALAAGFGYGFDFFNHELKIEEINNSTVFSASQNLSSNTFSSHNLEFPIELRWRTSTSKKYDFWRIYSGIKFIYNLSNTFKFTENSSNFSYRNVTSYRKLQYGLTISAGYDEFNLHVFYNLTPIFEDATLNGVNIDSSILKFGLIFYIL